MARNEVFRDADHLSLPVPANTVAGSPVLVGILRGVTQTDRADSTATPDPLRGPKVNTNPDGYATVWLKGAHTFTVSFAIAAIGDPVYITPGGALTATASGNTLYGAALNVKAATAGPLTVRIVGN